MKEYVKLREGIEEKLTKLSKESTPEQIEAHKRVSGRRQGRRSGAKHGDVLTPEIAAHIRAIIREEFKGKERQELRETVLEADTKGVPLRVNYPYPETKELVEMPPHAAAETPAVAQTGEVSLRQPGVAAG